MRPRLDQVQDSRFLDYSSSPVIFTPSAQIPKSENLEARVIEIDPTRWLKPTLLQTPILQFLYNSIKPLVRSRDRHQAGLQPVEYPNTVLDLRLSSSNDFPENYIPGLKIVWLKTL